jgi:type II secretory pathway component PulL
MARIGLISVNKVLKSGVESLEEADLYILDADSGNIISSEKISLSPAKTKNLALKGTGNLYLSMPLDMLSYRILRLPFSDKDKLREVIPFELQGLILENPDDIVFDSVCLGKRDDAFDILVAYMGKRQFADLLNTLNSVGIDPPVAGSIELSNIVRETSDPVAVIERLTGQDGIIGDRGGTSRKIMDFFTPEGLLQMIDTIRDEIKNPLINLRTGDLEFRGDKARLSRLSRITLFLLITIAITINIDLTLRIVKEKRDISLLREETRRSYFRLFPSEKRVQDEYYQLKAHLREVKDKSDLIKGIPVLDFLLRLSDTERGRVIFHEIGLSTEGLSLKGEASSMDEIDNIKARLSGIIQEINLSETKPTGSGKYLFTISGRIKG